MSKKRVPERRIVELRLRFFPTPSTVTSQQTNKWVISSWVTTADVTRHSNYLYAQCDCAYK
jgi:hypothetical protein